MHDTIGCYLDLEQAQISFSKNGIILVRFLVNLSVNLLLCQ